MQKKHIIGFLDSVSGAGFIEGWAKSAVDDFHVISVSILWNGAPIGVAVANLFRADLAANKVGHGWHAFQVLPNVLLPSHEPHTLTLVETHTNTSIATARLEAPRRPSTDSTTEMQTFLDDHPLQVRDVDTLALTAPYIEAFVASHGTERFVEFAYCYILGRPADPSGRQWYADLIAQGKVKPFELLTVLFQSEERTRSNWIIVPPSHSGFPFRPGR
jgi:hypothetical protein